MKVGDQMSLYDVKDFVCTSQMESKRDTYKSIMDDMKDMIDEVNEKIKNFEESYSDELSAWKAGTRKSRGTINGCYWDKIEIYEEKEKTLISYFNDCIEKYEAARLEIEEKYEYYKEQADLEDEQEKEIKE